ncbi:hypothetical protein, partial [Streptomyces sp. NPDC056661]|uniref:hypothetical protein n=1 Tax=Streptomyces sp. NPDC056661 TaxID=3345898 RepID=UPI00367DB84F
WVEPNIDPDSGGGYSDLDDPPQTDHPYDTILPFDHEVSSYPNRPDNDPPFESGSGSEAGDEGSEPDNWVEVGADWEEARSTETESVAPRTGNSVKANPAATDAGGSEGSSARPSGDGLEGAYWEWAGNGFHGAPPPPGIAFAANPTPGVAVAAEAAVAQAAQGMTAFGLRWAIP